MWSCGVTLYVMLFGAYPFRDSKDPMNVKKTMQVRAGLAAEWTVGLFNSPIFKGGGCHRNP